MVVNYMPVILLVLLKKKVKDVNLTVKMVNSGWNATVKKVSLVKNVKMMLLLILKRNNI
jgi:ATP-dependent phosphoenolpyruvate carboxykinase